jgi:SAM-dependent methyltransferase
MALSDRLAAHEYYDRDAAGYAACYDSVTFNAVHPLLSRYLPSTGSALDIGAGSGRDARAMSEHGLDVTAVEPSAGLRAIGAASDPRIRWIDDRLPDLLSMADHAGRFDFILCSAVLMLVSPADLAASFATMARFLAPAGRIGIDVRQPKTDEPADLFFAHSDDAILAAAAAAELSPLDRAEAEDALGRERYRWRSFIFEQDR